MKSVYLAGPIDGLSWDESTDWRDHATAVLGFEGIAARSPLRAKNYLKGHVKLGDTAAHGKLSVLSTARGIMTRDRFDATTCDVLLANLGGAKKVSVGTVMEIAWADLYRIPIVAVMEPGNVHEHAMVEEALGFRVNTLDEALDVVKAILAF